MDEKLRLHIDGAEHFVLLEAILNWDTSNYALKDKLEATRESLQTKLEELGEEEMERTPFIFPSANDEESISG